MYDTHAPSSLVRVQRWFGSIISRPLNDGGGIQATTPRLAPIELEATEFIRPSKTMRSHQRIELYNQQYWWRLIDVMQETYALTCALYGYDMFNFEMAVPYLDSHPPCSWSLNHLGEGFAEGLEGRARAAATLDWAYHTGFTAAHHPSIREVGGDPTEWMERAIQLQPHLALITLAYPYPQVRKRILAGEEVEVEERPTHYAIYRNRQNGMTYKELAEGELHLLLAIKGGKTLHEAADLLEESQAESLAYWVQDWILRDWLYGVA
ncbi:MAG: putative DNA-binding domain-containing protein [Parachlamydiales bacterium]